MMIATFRFWAHICFPTMKYQRSRWSWVMVVLFGYSAIGSLVNHGYVVAVGFALLATWARHRGDPSITGWLSQRKLAIAGTLLVVVPYVLSAIGVAGLALSR